MPAAQSEKDKLGSLGGKAHDLTDDNKDKFASQSRGKKDELLDKADAALHPSADASSGTDAPSLEGASRTFKPFIAAH